MPNIELGSPPSYVFVRGVNIAILPTAGHTPRKLNWGRRRKQHTHQSGNSPKSPLWIPTLRSNLEHSTGPCWNELELSSEFDAVELMYFHLTANLDYCMHWLSAGDNWCDQDRVTSLPYSRLLPGWGVTSDIRTYITFYITDVLFPIVLIVVEHHYLWLCTGCALAGEVQTTAVLRSDFRNYTE